MMWLKACPRCGGDLFVEDDVGESYIICLQCGYVLPQAQAERLMAEFRPIQPQPKAA
ncbi:MAG: hypothetical protein M1136_02660 [Chloroflexi bacterium]|nr:hypothetical protein [Chloroflexota bacterium]